MLINDSEDKSSDSILQVRQEETNVRENKERRASLLSLQRKDHRMIQSSFGARSTASEVVAGHDLSGKTVVITGASAGIGYETARALLSAHAEVIIAGRSQAKGEQAVWALQTAYPGSQVHFLPLDLGSLASVRQTVEHFFAAQPLPPAFRGAAPPRFVSLTSAPHRLSDIHFDDIQYQHRPYDKWEAYAQSKTADALLAVALTRHFGEQGITANAVNPGGVRTGLQEQYLTPEEIRARYYDEAGNLLPSFKTPEQRPSTTVSACLAPRLEGTGGLYLEHCHHAIPYY